MSDFWIRTNALIKQQNKTQRGLSIECGFSDRKIENQSSNVPYRFAIISFDKSACFDISYIFPLAGFSPLKEKPNFLTNISSISE